MELCRVCRITGEGSTSADSALSYGADSNPLMPSSRTAPGSGSLWPEHSAPIKECIFSLHIDNEQGRFLFQGISEVGEARLSA